REEGRGKREGGNAMKGSSVARRATTRLSLRSPLPSSRFPLPAYLSRAFQGASVRGKDSVHLCRSVISNSTFFQPERADGGRSTKGGFMSSRDLPARPNLDHLKNEAKALHKAFNDRDATAVQRVRAVLGDVQSIKLTDAQRVISREYGMP